AVLRGFGNGEVAPFQHVIEIHRCDLSADDGNTANLLRLVFVVALFGDGINSGGEIVELDFTVWAGLNDLIYAISRNRKSDSLNLAVLAGFHDFGTAVAYLDIEIAF